MSRSYRKHPLLKCKGCSKFAKRRANKRLRTISIYTEIPNHRQFKKMFESYEIYDYCCTQSKKEAINDWYKDQAEIINGVNPYKARFKVTLGEAINDWYLMYKRK